MGAPHYRRISGAPGKREVLSNERTVLHISLYIIYNMYTGLLQYVYRIVVITIIFTTIQQACDCMYSPVATINKPVSFKNYRIATIL